MQKKSDAKKGGWNIVWSVVLFLAVLLFVALLLWIIITPQYERIMSPVSDSTPLHQYGKLNWETQIHQAALPEDISQQKTFS